MRRLRPPASTSPYKIAGFGTFAFGEHSAGETSLVEWPKAVPTRALSSEITLASGLFQKFHFGDDDAMRQGLAHVVHRQRRRGGPDQGFHFHAGAMRGFGRAFDAHPLSFHGKGNFAFVQRQRSEEHTS